MSPWPRQVPVRAFSLVEILVVIGIIAVLIALLLPVLTMARVAARSVQCQSNMRQIGQALVMYANGNGGWMIPVVADAGEPGGVRGMGTLLPPSQRWPAVVFKFHVPAVESDDPKDYCPEVVRCPADIDPVGAHSYMLSAQIAVNHCKLGSSNFAGQSASEVIVAVEKVSDSPDYYVETDKADDSRIMNYYRHGLRRGSNYLYFDGHVESHLPGDALHLQLDPWTVRGVGSTANP
jgi:prepilin-type processing-associated H-X9-DG protein